MKRSPIHHLSLAFASLSLLGVTLAVEPGNKGEFLWAVACSLAGIFSGVVIGACHVRHAVWKELQEMKDERRDQTH